MSEKTLKGLVHAALALAGLFEARMATTRTRKLLTGAMIGWHTHAAFYHFVLEKDVEE
jgi:hypothetical protein